MKEKFYDEDARVFDTLKDYMNSEEFKNEVWHDEKNN